MFLTNQNAEIVACILLPPIFNTYSRNICACLVGDPSLKSPACLKEPRRVFVSKSWFKSAANLAIEEQVSQAVESRNASSSKTKHPSRTYGSFAKLRHVSVLEIRTAF